MRYVVIGNGAAGVAAARAIGIRDPHGNVLMLAEEPHCAYFRVQIPSVAAGERAPSTLLRADLNPWNHVEERVSVRVAGIDAPGRRIKVEGHQPIEYDRLLLATGAAAADLDASAPAEAGVYKLRTLDDAIRLEAAARLARRAIVVGAGGVGIKAALALKKHGLDVTLVEAGPHLLPRQVDPRAGEILGQALEAQGVCLRVGEPATGTDGGHGGFQSLALATGEVLDAELIVLAMGIRPRMDLAAHAGLACKQGVVVYRDLRTSDPHIYAAGDVAEIPDVVTGRFIVSGLWTNAVEMGAVAGANMAGGRVDYRGGFAVLSALQIGDTPMMAVGMTQPPDSDSNARYTVHHEGWGNDYRKLVLRDGHLVGAVLVGSIEAGGVYTGLIRRQAFVAPHVDALLASPPSYAPWLVRKKVPEGVGG